MPETLSRPTVTITRRGAERIRAGHVWVYRSDLIETGGAGPGSLVRVTEDAGRGRRPNINNSDKLTLSGAEGHVRATRHVLGSGLYSSSSEIALRLISRKPIDNLEQLVRNQIREATAYRERFVHDTDAYRVIFSESDFLPGLIVDRYNDLLSMQVLTQAMDREEMRRIVVSELVDAFKPRAIVERVDARIRKLEQLEEKQSGVIWETPNTSADTAGSIDLIASTGAQSSPVQTRLSAPTGASQLTTGFQMNGVSFLYDAVGGQKTGAFLDQRENYAAAAQYARGGALDVFCYQGGFALHLARVCDRVTGVDSSRPALEAAERNAALNDRQIEWIEANAFDLLRDYSDSGQKYDSIVLDPPAFAKSKRDLATALRGYKELNLRALKMLRPDGVLVTCSCSYHVSRADFLEAVASAALDSHRIIRILENRGAAKDHPSILGIPETSYMKCLILLVS